MTDKEVMQMALDALNTLAKELIACRDELAERGARPETPHKQKLWDSAFNAYTGMAIPTYEAIRARLAQPEPEPVAWRFHDKNMWCYVDHLTDLPQDKFKPLYTTPPQREWVGLTDEEIREGNKDSWVTRQAWESAAWWAEEKLKEKNT